MITDPKTAPTSPTRRIVYAVVARAARIAADRGGDDGVREQGGAALLARGRLPGDADCCGACRIAGRPSARTRWRRRPCSRRSPACSSCRTRSRRRPCRALPPGTLPPITILAVARRADPARSPHGAADRARPAVDRPRDRRRPADPAPRARRGQSPPVAVAQLAGQSLPAAPAGERPLGARRDSAGARSQRPAPSSSALGGPRLTNVAPSLGLDFQQGAFRYGMSNDTRR